MKTIFIHIVLGVMFCISTAAFAQERYTDEEIRFDRKSIESVLRDDKSAEFPNVRGTLEEKLAQIRKQYIDRYNSIKKTANKSADSPLVNPTCTNMDFSDGTFNGWCRYTSPYASINSVVYDPAVTGYCEPNDIVYNESYEGFNLQFTDSTRFEIINKNVFNDSFIGTGSGFPENIQNVARIGNSLSNGKADEIRQIFTLNENNTIYKFNYAIVLENPQHPSILDQPQFNFRILVNDIGVACAGRNFVADNVPNFISVEIPSQNEFDGTTLVEYLDWQTFSIDLAAYANLGDEITIIVSTRDCNQGAHFAYAYFSAECGASNLGINVTSNSDTFCPGETLTFTNEAIGTFNNESYLWTFNDANGTTTSTEANPTYVFNAPGSYTVDLAITIAGETCSQLFSREVVVVSYSECDDDPCDTVAIIVDESGSLSEQEIQDIKRGLTRFIEDQLDSGLNISLIGMSDSDGRVGIDSPENIRPETDHIIRKKVTSVPNPDTGEPATKPIFDQWIASYGNRNGETGISGSSDYWASALNVVKNSDHTPKLVVILTDGSQTADIGYLQEQINWVRQNSNLYVYGIDNEYYVNSDNVNARLSRSQDPNYSTIDRKQTRSFNNSTSRGVVSSIRTSLDYLFGNTDEDEPISGQENLLAADYYGYDDFSGISDAYGTELGVLSNLLAQSQLNNVGISCTSPVDECYACYSFQPEPSKTYWLSGWVKADLNTQIKSYTDLNFIDAGGNPIIAAPSIELTYWDAADIEIPSTNPYPSIFYPSGNIIDGWQRIAGKFKIPENTVTLDIELYNSSPNIPVYFDDIRVHPIKGSMKSFVYDPVTYRLMAELDENNYSTYYEYDNEGGLVRVKKETSRGIKTIQETRSGTVINNSNSNTNNDEN